MLQNTSLLLTVMDQDRYCGPVELGHTTISMKEAKQTIPEPEKFSTTQIIKQSKKVTNTNITQAKYANKITSDYLTILSKTVHNQFLYDP